MNVNEATLADFVATKLEARAEGLVQEWIDWIQEQVRHPVVRALPREAIRNHIPPVLQSLARFVRNPTFALREEMLGHLRLHGQIRCDQGYGLRELLAEFDALAQRVQSAMREETVAAARMGWRIDEGLEVFGRLATGLRAIVFVAGGTYRETEQMRASMLARHLSEFGQTIAHELRTPLQAVLISAEALQNDGGTEPATRTEQIDVIKEAARRAAGLLDDINVLAATETARSEARIQDLKLILDIVHQEMAHIADEAGVDLVFPTLEEPFAVESVVGQLVLVNLVSNGIKYSDPEKPERWVRVDVEPLDSGEMTAFVRLSVSDNGLGVPDEFQSHVFQRRFRAHPGVASGTGLGLAVCQSLVTERGGSIELLSEPGEGSKVTFTLHAIDLERPLSTAYHTTKADELIELSVKNLIDTAGSDDRRTDS